MEADQDCDDLGIRHHALSAPLRSISGTRKCVFCHLDLKFLAEIVRDTKNFSKLGIENWEFLPNFHSLISRELGF